ncbi:MAG: hypothetical protein JXR68_00725 [Bacteroidales bacterium]|nr:hypothetical protein [Bacteroidales bacterium]
MTKIANPIYDVVFKYLMSDNKIAKLMLSTIIGKEVNNLQFRDTEKRNDIDKSIKYHRLDFSAEILDETGKKEIVIIELQKIRLPADIVRFRRYLGEQYMNKENTYTGENEKGDPEVKAMPILSIYFLGYKLYKTDAPVVKINRKTIDIATNEPITEKTEFTESLTHDSFIIQIPYLKEKRRNDVEKLLAIFDQSYQDKEDYHALNLNEDDFPEKYREIIRRLVKANSEPDIRRKMDMEDDLVEEIRNKDLAIAKRDLAIEEQKKNLLETAKLLKQLKVDINTIIEKTGLSRDEIERI